MMTEMFDYYDERAGEYEELYTRGAGPACIPDQEAYVRESAALGEIAGRLCEGHVIDIACGTGFWMPSYADSCPSITLFDQSAKMLAECRSKTDSLGITDKCTFVQGDFFGQDFGRDAFDMAVIGCFLSHVPEDMEQAFFTKLKGMLKPGGRFLVLDSIWNDERAKAREKVGAHERTLNDGRQFEIYKRYFVEDDFKAMAETSGVSMEVVYAGRVFIVAVGTIDT